AAAAVADAADDGPRAELLDDHPELTALALESGVLALLLWGALSWIAAGGLLSGEKFLHGCVDNARRMLALGVVGLPLRLLALAGPLAAWAIADGAHDFRTVLAGGGVAVIIGGIIWSLATVTLDRARGLALARPELRPWQALRKGLDASWARRGNTLALALLSGGGFAAVTLLQLAA